MNHVCFHDSNYFCLCQPGQKRVDCFRHNPSLDYCDLCLSGAKCIKGNLKNPNDFICICRHCYQGRLCEFSLEAFGFTLDSLLAFDSITVQTVYIGLTLILFCVGLFSNLCSFVTFKRAQPRKFGVGNYLFIVTILNQWSLLWLLLRFIHILLGSAGHTNDSSCKTVTYLLSTFTRSTYWLTSWITVDRLLIILFPTSTSSRNPHIAIYSSICTMFALFAMHIHEILYYKTIREPDSSVVLCVPNFDQRIVANYNRAATIFHYMLPFCIQIVSITLLIILAGRSRAKTAGNRVLLSQMLKQQFSIQKELYVTPAIIILSALPQAILSFSLACTQLSDWSRHMLLGTFLLSYSPQVLGFILYVLPSSGYKKEFGETIIAKKYFRWMLKTKAKRGEMIATTRRTDTHQ